MKLTLPALAAILTLAASAVQAQPIEQHAALTRAVNPVAGESIATPAQMRYEGRNYRRPGYGRPGRGARSTTVRELPNGCRIVTTRMRAPDGSMVTRRMRRC